MNSSEPQSRLSTLDRPYAFSSPFSGEEFAALIWVIDTGVSEEERARVTVQLVKQGCRYAVCAGRDCEIWHDSIDWAFLETDPDFQPPNGKFVMTTWHEGEGVEEVAEFFALNTSFDNFAAKNFLMLFIGRDEDLEKRVAEAVKSFLTPRAA